MNNVTDYTTLKIDVTNFTKPNKLFSIGRARIFYIGPNQNRTIISEEVGEQLISTIPGTPIVGVFDGKDFGGHEEGQTAFGFVPLEPNAKKVTVEEVIMGVPVKRSYYEVDVVIWDGRFPEAGMILGAEKSLSMELNRDTLQGEFEVYENKHYCRFTHAEFIGITVLGEDKTPCFKDAKFLQTYTAMLSAYSAMIEEQQSENQIGGKEDMSVINSDSPIIDENVESNKKDDTIVNEGTVVENTTEESSAKPADNTEATDYEDVTEEETTTETAEETSEEVSGTEEEVVEQSNEVEEEIVEVTENEEVVTTEEESADEAGEENGTEEDEEVGTDTALLKKLGEMEAINDTLNEKVESLTAKLGAYEREAKEELIETFSKKIDDSEFLNTISSEMDNYSVEDLKAKLGSKLADQIVAEEANSSKKVAMNYSYTTLVEEQLSSKKGDWTDLVRENKKNN